MWSCRMLFGAYRFDQLRCDVESQNDATHHRSELESQEREDEQVKVEPQVAGENGFHDALLGA